MFKWLSKIFGSKPTPTATTLPPKPEAVKAVIPDRIVTTENLQAHGRATRTAPSQPRRVATAHSPSRSSVSDDSTYRRRDNYVDDTLLNPLNPISPIYVGNNYADSAPSQSYSDRSETCAPSYSSSYDSGSSSSSYDSGSSSSDSGSCGGSD